MIADLRRPAANSTAIGSAIHAFTSGHLAATETIVATIAKRPGLPPDLRAILGEPAPRREFSGTVAGAILDSLLQGASDLLEDLTTCSAARHQADALRLAAGSPFLARFREDERVLFSDEFWVRQDHGEPPVMLPVLRRLLLQRLAARGQGSFARWDDVHRWLGHQADRTGYQDDRARALYHELALGNVEPVARELADRLYTVNAEAWLSLLANVTAAPRWPGGSQDAPPPVSELTRWVSPQDQPLASVVRLVAYAWLAADPLNAPHWGMLLRGASVELEQIAPYLMDDGLIVLREEAKHYRYAAESPWGDREAFWITRPRSRP